MEKQYYDGTKLLSMKDLNGRTPELYICTTNRTGGKTTWFNRYVIKRYMNGKGKFVLLNRFNYELDDIADKFFKDIGSLFFIGWEMISKRKANGIYHELFLVKNHDESTAESCGYAISLNSADQLKRYSHLFSDATCILFDEFQSETNHYCNDEVAKFLSIHTSLARGQGEQVKYLPVYMLGNQVSIINPYYTELEITSRLNDKVNFLRGDGYVLENGFIESASEAQKDSGVNRAFKKNTYVAYASENVYLNDNLSFIDRPIGKSRYLATIKYKNVEYGIREFREEGVIYCDDHADKSFPMRISVTTDDHNINYVMLKSNNLFIANMRFYFEHGAFRFKDLRSKEALLKCISY